VSCQNGVPMKADVIHIGNKDVIRRAVEVLEGGGIVAFPTDTVYGVAVMPWDDDAVARMYEIKQRSLDKPIPLLLSDVDHLSRVAELPLQHERSCKRLIARFWPGGLTLVLPKTQLVSDIISHSSTVAVRVPGLALARDVIREAGGVLAVTSANRSGFPSPVTAFEVEEQLGDRIDLILNGGVTRGGVPSSILDCTVSPPRLLRHGIITEATLCSVMETIDTL
jgi:L-threonylcarbamoyladenylate synthase